METITLSSEKLIHIDKPDSIWEHLRSKNEILYFWLGRQSYHPIWDLQKKLHTKRVSGEIPDIILFLSISVALKGTSKKKLI